MIDQVYDSKAFAENRDNLFGTFKDMLDEGITSLHHTEVARIAKDFRFNYATGKTMCKRLGIKVK